VLLLDEPTSGLDAASQALVLRAIARLRGVRSVVLVTHRPEPLAICDRVVQLGASEVVEAVDGGARAQGAHVPVTTGVFASEQRPVVSADVELVVGDERRVQVGARR